MIRPHDSVKPKKTKNITWIAISASAAVIVICLAAYFYFFYFKSPGLAGLKSWIASEENPDTSESAQQESSLGQSEVKPELVSIEVMVERVDIKPADALNGDAENEDAENTLDVKNTEASLSTDSIKDTAATENADSVNNASNSSTETTETTSSTSSEETIDSTATNISSEEANVSATTTTIESTSSSSKKSGQIYIGDTVKFDILIKNNGPLPAKNIKIIDLPPDKLEYINIAKGSVGLYDPFSRKIVLDIAEIAPGETIKIAFTGFISNDLDDGEIIENKVSALYKDESIAEESTELSVVGLPDYTATIVKVEDVNGSKIWAKDILKYSVIVKNSGKKAGGNIILNCPMPTGTGYVDETAYGSGLIVNPNKTLLQFNIGKIQPGSQKEFSFKAFVAEYITFSSEIKSGFFITDGPEIISLENTSVTTEASVFQTVVSLGDSQVASSDYADQLGVLLNNQYSHAVFNVIPSGVNGEMADFAIQRFDKDVRMHNPDIIVIGYGSNDAGEPTGLYRYHMDILVRQAVSTGAKVIVYGIGYIDLSIPKWLGKANYTIFNEILKNDICPKYGAVYADLYSPMSKDYKKYIKEDGMHWSEEGVTLASVEVFKAITTLLDTEGKILTGSEE